MVKARRIRRKDMSVKSQGMQINLSEQPTLMCQVCNGVEFIQVMRGAVVSEILSPRGQKELVFHPLRFACAKCGTAPDGSAVGNPQVPPKPVLIGGGQA